MRQIFLVLFTLLIGWKARVLREYQRTKPVVLSYFQFEIPCVDHKK
jgi:hypothetical protein